MTWQELLGSLLMLLGIGGVIIMLAEMLCGLLDLPRRTPDVDASESEVDAEWRRICEEVEAEVAAAAKRCEVQS